LKYVVTRWLPSIDAYDVPYDPLYDDLVPKQNSWLHACKVKGPCSVVQGAVDILLFR